MVTCFWWDQAFGVDLFIFRAGVGVEMNCQGLCLCRNIGDVDVSSLRDFVG